MRIRYNFYRIKFWFPRQCRQFRRPTHSPLMLHVITVHNPTFISCHNQRQELLIFVHRKQRKTVNDSPVPLLCSKHMWDSMIRLSGKKHFHPFLWWKLKILDNSGCFVRIAPKPLFKREKNVHILAYHDSFCFLSWVYEVIDDICWRQLHPSGKLDACITASNDH